MTRTFLATIFAAGFLLFSVPSLAGTTQTTAEILECNSCYTNFDFKQKAKENAVRNEVSFFLVYNSLSQQMKTVRTLNIYEPMDGIIFTRATIITSFAEHQASFDLYVVSQQSGDIPSHIEIDIDQNFYPSAPYDVFIPVNQYLLSQYGVFYKATVPISTVITVTTPDGTRVVLVKLSAITATPAQYLIALVLDEEGNIIDIVGGSSMSNTGGGANGGGSTSITLPGGVLICFGECTGSPGEVIPGPIVPKEE
jgi:hypothetical protein